MKEFVERIGLLERTVIRRLKKGDDRVSIDTLEFARPVLSEIDRTSDLPNPGLGDIGLPLVSESLPKIIAEIRSKRLVEPTNNESATPHDNIGVGS